MKRILSLIIIALAALNIMPTSAKTVRIKVVQTTDIHGNFFPYDFINRKAWGGSLARVHTFVENERATYGDNLILLDRKSVV